MDRSETRCGRRTIEVSRDGDRRERAPRGNEGPRHFAMAGPMISPSIGDCSEQARMARIARTEEKPCRACSLSNRSRSRRGPLLSIRQ